MAFGSKIASRYYIYAGGGCRLAWRYGSQVATLDPKQMASNTFHGCDAATSELAKLGPCLQDPINPLDFPPRKWSQGFPRLFIDHHDSLLLSWHCGQSRGPAASRNLQNWEFQSLCCRQWLGALTRWQSGLLVSSLIPLQWAWATSTLWEEESTLKYSTMNDLNFQACTKLSRKIFQTIPNSRLAFLLLSNLPQFQVTAV